MSKKIFLKTIFSRANAPILIIISLLSCFTLGLFILNSYWGYKKEIERASSDNRSLAIALEQYTDTQFKNADLVLFQVRTLLSFINLNSSSDLKQLSRLLDEMNEANQGVESIGVSDHLGKIIANTDWLSAKDINIHDRQYFIDQKNNTGDDLIFSDPIISRATGNQIIIICRKRPHLPGEFNGVILASLNLRKLIETFTTIGSIEGGAGALSLLNTNYTLLARFPFQNEHIGKTLNKNLKLVTLHASGLKNATFESKSVMDGISRIYSFRELKNFPLLVVTGKDKYEILRNWQRYVLTTGLIGLIFSILILVALYKYFKNLYESEKQKIMILNASRMSAVGVVAAGIAHEINNPLTIVTGRAMQIISMLEREEAIDLEKIKSNAFKINETCFRIAKVVKGLKSLSQDSEDEVMEKHSLHEIIETALDLSREKMMSEGVELSITVLGDFFIRCKLNQLSQVFLNLINHSFETIKNLPEKWINIEAHLSDKNVIQISINDSGPGVPNEIADIINAPSFITKSTDKSIGLDLSVSKTIVESYGGEFYVDKAGGHTRFVIKLSILP